MRTFYVTLVLCLISNNLASALYSDEDTDIHETCCSHGQTQAVVASSAAACAALSLPEDIDPGSADICKEVVTTCCQEHFRNKDECVLGMKYAAEKRCDVPTTETGKTCCEECSFGRWTGESGGVGGCGEASSDDTSPSLALRAFAYHQCCLEAAKEQELTTKKKEEETTTATTEKVTTTTEKKIETTTEKKAEVTTDKRVGGEKCKPESCEQVCNDESGTVTCQCHEGYRLQGDKKSCKDINECREAIDDVCSNENEVCHNTAGSFKCVPIKKREVGMNCPPGFKMNVLNQVCDDVNECQLPRPPCPKYLCENTIGGYKCGGKPGKPAEEAPAGVPSKPLPPAALPDPGLEPPKNDICPPGFRAGPDDECIDVDECEEHADDCQRLSQYCINTNGGFFCQDHVSKRCAPGFKVNRITGICEDIDECEESSEVCKRSQVCINLAGAYNCKSKISTLPKLATKTCQEGTRLKPGGTVCEDIDECREGTHLCDQFQNCVNTYGGHECRCKNGFELDSSSGSCVDIDECALKLDNCSPGQHCLNVLGAYTCARRAPAPPTPAPPPARPRAPTTTPRPTTTAEEATVLTSTDDYYYYDSDDETPPATETTTSTTPKPTSPPPTELPRRPSYPRYPYHTTTTIRTSLRPERPRYLRPSTTTEAPSTEASTLPEERPYERPEYPPTYPERPYQPENRPRPSYPRPEYPEDNSVQPYDETERRPEYRPRPTEATRPPPRPTPPPRTNEPPRGYPTEVAVDKPTDDAVVVEKDKDKDGSYGVDTSDIPKNQWTNVVGKEKPEDPSFDVNNIHCLNGYERDQYGNCVDINECDGNRHICSTLESCTNMEGGYRCDCISGFQRDLSGWCVPVRHPSTTPKTTPPPPTPAPTTPRTVATTTSTTTERTTTETEVATTPRWRYTPPNRPRRPYTPPTDVSCELGYAFDSSLGRCVDIDECARNDRICAPNEDCVNQEGGYYCACGARCRAAATEVPPHPPFDPETPSIPPASPFIPTLPEPAAGPYHPTLPPPAAGPYQPTLPSPADPYQPSSSDAESNVITVGAQYGQRGPRYLRPSFTRLPNSGAIVTSCLWGYKLTQDKMCYDIDECAKNVSKCGPDQRCENFFGGYSCQCPPGHKLYGKDGCEDIDECAYGSPCAYNAKCVNTVGSYRCECGDGFRNSLSNDKMCVDVDECTETPQVCHQSCSNVWGSYRCYCKRGYRLGSDNRTCVDVDECAEWGSARLRGRLCGGECRNEPGSYRCACPHGYRLADDGKSCIDIDECETGEATCASSRDPGHVCQNTRGSYHCHHIDCPPGYRLEGKHRCTRIQRSCPISDWGCLRQPSAYSYNFITFVANIYLPSGSVDLFTMHGPSWRDSVVSFELRMIDAKASPGIKPADLRCFDMRPMDNVCVISLLCSLGGPQVAELELTMSLYQRGQFAGNAVARLVIIVSQYEY